jgi:hypothetical protein
MADSLMALPLFVASHRFDPRSIPGLESWWDAADAASVTLDSGRVSQLADKSGKGRHAANTTSGSTQPSYVTAGRNGLNVVRFAAASVQRLTVASSTATYNFLHNGTDSFIAAVSVYGTSDNPNAAYSLFGNNGQSSANVGSVFYYDDRVISTTFAANNAIQSLATVGGGNLNAIRLLNSLTTAPLAAYNGIVTPQSVLVQEAVIDANNATVSQRFRLRLNGGSEIAANESAGTAVASNATFNFQIGSNGNNGNTLEGDICELLIFSQIPTAAARDLIRRYLGSKWGIALA